MFARVQALSPNEFRRTYRMDLACFNKILSTIRDDLECKAPESVRGAEITPEIKLSMTLRWLAGGSYLDIYQMHGVSYSSFQKALWQTIDAIDTRSASEPLMATL